ncbi:MAG: methylmalonyl Co-A mutase-associated GTPase MeaB [Halorientalis sp.]
MTAGEQDLVASLLDGEHRALARVISKIEDREPGYRDLVSRLHEHTGHADVVGITGSPGAGKSTLVDKLAESYREQGLTVGVIAIDPSSPFTGGAVLGDRIRMASNVGDMDVFFRSMSARGSLGGLSTATTDAVKALDAFGKDKILVETVGAGQNEVDIVRTADTVAVLVPPASGDDVQMLKAGILEIADLFVVNKADMDGADRTVQELREMIEMRRDEVAVATGHHGTAEMGLDGPSGESGVVEADQGERDSPTESGPAWTPPVLETVAKTGEGVPELIAAFDEHRAFLAESGQLVEKERERYASEIRTLLREDTARLLADEIEARGGMETFVDRVVERETDPYAVADDLLEPIADCVEAERD